jgi:preprotein translocase subunit SecG
MNTTLVTGLNIVQVVLSVAMIALIILQSKGSGIGNLLGGGESGLGITKTRRGLDRTLFQMTIIGGAIWLLLAILRMMVQN